MSSNPPLQTSFIHGQKSLLITGGYFQQNIYNSSEQGLSTLLQAASLSAGHDASDRDPPPRCARGTREKVITDVMDWITDFSPRKSIMWLNGPFGNGKSALSSYADDRGGKFGRDKAKYLIPTIAYQIATSIPSMRQVINYALIQDPTILNSKSIDAQLRYLITKPLHEVASTPFHTPTVLIDGLDECEGHDFQRLILKAISAAVLKEHIPLRFLIASRPEPQISETFRTQPLDQHHCSITLVDDYQTCEELRKFFRSGFDEMYQRRSDLLYTVKQPWPSKEDLSTLVNRASGQFLYASTVLRFVDSDMAHPKSQLALILQRRPGNAFSNMDELYMQILESCPCQKILPSFLRSLLTKQALKSEHHSTGTWFFKPTLANYSAVSGLQPNDISVILRWLPAIVEVERPPSPQYNLPDDWPLQEIMQLYSPKLSIHHQSFIEFITDHRRSGMFHIDMDTAYQEMKACLDALLAESLSEGEQTPRIHRSTWEVIDHLLRRDLRVHSLGPSLGWPHLRKTLNDFEEGRTRRLSKPCPEFLDALRHVLYALETSLDLNPEDHIIQKFTIMLTDIYDQTFLLTIPPNSKLWKIAGALTVASVLDETKSFHWQFFNPGRAWTYSHYIDDLPQLSGLTFSTIFRALEENWNFFDVDISCYPQPKSCRFLIHMRHHEDFLEDEFRSKDLYVTYRNSAVRALEFGVKELTSAQALGMIFTSFCAHGWDIWIDEDLRKASAMGEVIDLLLHNNSIMPKILRQGEHFFSDRDLDDMGASPVSLQWLIKQLHILNAVENPNHSITKMIQDLDIVSLYKEDAIILAFDCGRQRFRSTRRLNCDLK